tara:strand:- start:2186 stop:3148 length:963 start_codon:yes stop_codon:yes gene_type:complete
MQKTAYKLTDLYDTISRWWKVSSWFHIGMVLSIGMIVLWIMVMILTGVNIFSVFYMYKSSPRKIVVFDLDETLGSFVELGMFWDAIKNILGDEYASQHDFNRLMKLFPEFTRPNIIEILRYLVDKRSQKECYKIMIYTNNQGPRSWAQMITEYFDSRIGEKVFDQIIAAFRVRGKSVELCRTSHDKSVDDLIRCTRIPKNTQICFLDDQHHPMMEDNNVYYINVKPYSYSMPYDVMASRYYKNVHIDMNKKDFEKSIVNFMNKYSYTVSPKSKVEIDVDQIISKQIMFHLEDFFKQNVKKRKTLKKWKKSRRRRTLKKQP